MEFAVVGILGMFCICAAWIPQTLRTIKTKKTGIDPRFLWLYVFGSAFLAIYAFLISDLVFLALNVFATVLDVINIYYYYRYEAKEKRKKKGKKK